MTTDDGSAPLDRAILGIRNAEGTRVGVGFLVAPDLALTCAHVVSNAVGAGAGVQVALDLPLVSVSRSDNDSGTVWATIEHWEPPAPNGGGDIAVLRLRVPCRRGGR